MLTKRPKRSFFIEKKYNDFIPEGAVVLTREEYEKLDKYIKSVDVYEMKMKNGKIDMTDYILVKRAYFGTYTFLIIDALALIDFMAFFISEKS